MSDSKDILAINSHTITAIIREYVPYSFRHTILVDNTTIICPPRQKSEAHFIQYLFNKNPEIFRMFGSSKELWKQISKFLNFQGNIQFLNIGGLYYHSRKFYHDMYSNKVFVCKNDFFLIVQNWFLSMKPNLAGTIPRSVFMLFLNCREKQLDGRCEYVEYDEEEEQKLRAELFNMLSLTPNYIVPISGALYNQEQLCESLASLLAGDVPREQMGSIFNKVKTMLGNPQYLSDHAVFLENYCTTMITHLRKILDARPQWFLPFHKQAINSTAPLRRSIRVFLDKGSCLIDEQDLKYVLNGSQRSLENNNGQRNVYDIDAAIEMLEQPVNLVMIPVVRSKHSAVPIPSGNNSFCKFSADVLLEHLRDLFFGLRVFQTTSEERKNSLIEYFEELSNNFKPSICVYQLDGTEIEKICKVAIDKFGNNESPKTIRNVSRKGFMLHDLIEELKLLELDWFFPNITGYAKLAYRRVIFKKKGVFLRTCDMFDAIEICLMISVFMCFPKMAVFLHNQRSCYRVYGLECEMCLGSNEFPNSPDDAVSLASSGSTPTEKEIKQKSNAQTSEPIVPDPEIRKVECNESCKRERQEYQELKKKLCEMEEAINFMEDKEKESQEKIKNMKRQLKDQKTTHQESINQLETRENENEEKLIQKFNEVEKTLNSMSVKETESQKTIKSMKKELDDREKKHHESVKEIEEQLIVAHRQELSSISLKHKNKVRKMEELMIILSQASVSTSTPSSQSSPTTGSIYLELYKVKVSHQKENPFTKATNMANKLILFSEDVEMKSQAIDELAAITSVLPEYVRKMEKNIERIQENPNILPSELETMPECPMFSDKFLAEYQKISSFGQPPTPSSAKDCAICLCEIDTLDNSTIKCQRCTQMLHVKCATPWLTKQSICPTCKEKLLLQSEYPPL